MPITERGEPERLVQARVLLVAHADEAQLEQANDGREDLLPLQTGLREVRLDPLADGRERARELDHPGELGRLAGLAELRVVAMLLATPCIASRRLQVTG